MGACEQTPRHIFSECENIPYGNMTVLSQLLLRSWYLRWKSLFVSKIAFFFLHNGKDIAHILSFRYFLYNSVMAIILYFSCKTLLDFSFFFLSLKIQFIVYFLANCFFYFLLSIEILQGNVIICNIFIILNDKLILDYSGDWFVFILDGKNYF